MWVWLWIAGCARQTDLEALSARVDTLEQEKAAYENRIADLEASVTLLQSRQSALTAPSGIPALPSPEDEQLAAELLKRATEANDAGRYDEARELLSQLASNFGATRANKAAVRLAEEIAIVGIPEVPLSVERWYRKDKASLRGDVTLYVFFEVWCPHCKREVPKLVTTYERFHDKGLEIVGITRLTRDITEEQLETFLSESHITYPIAKDQGDTMTNAYGVKGIPAAAAVKDGQVIWRGHPAKLTDAHIEGWL